VRTLTRLADAAAALAGHSMASLGAFLVVLVWAATGPLFNFSDTWQLVINTGTTIVTFELVFLIQNTQNRDARAIHAKLDELIRVISRASDDLIGAERLTVAEIEELRTMTKERAKRPER
jgi:low affinity Fe/Cu permease